MVLIVCYEYKCLLVFLRLNVTCYSSFLFQMDSSSTPNVFSNNNDDFRGDEEHEFLTPDNRGKSKQVLTPDSRGKPKESPEAS